MDLTGTLIKEGWLKSPEIIEAFREIKRKDFLPDDSKDLADLNKALPIGYGQTISQPLVVAFMLELLKPREGDKVLDVGSGSGWTTALLSKLVGEKGKVIALEIVPELKEFGEENALKYGFVGKGIAEFIHGDGSEGYQEASPYDKILASASAAVLPKAWKEQLKPGGRIVAPIGNSIWLFEKAKEGKAEFKETEYPGFVFVPLINS